MSGDGPQPGSVHEATASKICHHRDPAVEDGFAGVAAKIEEPTRYTAPVDRRTIAVSEDFEIEMDGIRPIRQALFPGATLPAVGARVYINGVDNSITLGPNAAPRAKLTTALTGSNNDLVFTARAEGAAGNAIEVVYVDPLANNAVQSVVVDDVADTITVNLATGSGGAITSTAAQVANAIRENGAADDLVTVANAATNNGTGIVTAMGSSPLTGGDDDSETFKLGLVESTDAARDLAFVNFEQRGSF